MFRLRRDDNQSYAIMFFGMFSGQRSTLGNDLFGESRSIIFSLGKTYRLYSFLYLGSFGATTKSLNTCLVNLEDLIYGGSTD